MKDNRGKHQKNKWVDNNVWNISWRTKHDKNGHVNQSVEFYKAAHTIQSVKNEKKIADEYSKTPCHPTIQEFKVNTSESNSESNSAQIFKLKAWGS